jgi:hypothetical protein
MDRRWLWSPCQYYRFRKPQLELFKSLYMAIESEKSTSTVAISWKICKPYTNMVLCLWYEYGAEVLCLMATGTNLLCTIPNLLCSIPDILEYVAFRWYQWAYYWNEEMKEKMTCMTRSWSSRASEYLLLDHHISWYTSVTATIYHLCKLCRDPCIEWCNNC